MARPFSSVMPKPTQFSAIPWKSETAAFSTTVPPALTTILKFGFAKAKSMLAVVAPGAGNAPIAPAVISGPVLNRLSGY